MPPLYDDRRWEIGMWATVVVLGIACAGAITVAFGTPGLVTALAVVLLGVADVLRGCRGD